METTLNSTQFAQRLRNIMEAHELSATAFAEKLEVGRATISHLMSGRNKPSLDFVLKVVSTFADVDINELLYGVKSNPTLPDSRVKKLEQFQTKKMSLESVQESSENRFRESKNSTTQKSIDRIVIFYNDGTFTTHQPEDSE